jgi:hypothetical protein
MNMAPGLRKLMLMLHITTSVGWLGSVAGFLALALAGLNSPDALTVRAAYVASELLTRWVILPLCAASLVTGLVQSLGTPWGLFRHYWVLIKLLLTLLASALLLLHTGPIGEVASAAAARVLSSADLHDVRARLVFDASAALVVLLVNTALSVFKPRGLTEYGWRKQHEPSAAS